MKGLRSHKLMSRLSILVAGAAAGAAAVWLLSQRRTRAAATRGPDLRSMQDRLSELPECEGVRLRDLGDGIVEAFGSAPHADAVSKALAVLKDQAGAVFVVNRIWTPTSARERPADLSHTPRMRSRSES